MMEFVNGKDDISYMKYKNVPNHQPDKGYLAGNEWFIVVLIEHGL